MIEYLAQHGGFYLEAAEILKQDRRMGIFHPEILVTHPSLPHIEADLPEREQIRSSAVCVSGFGAEDHTLERDQRYSSLDRHHNSLTCSHVYTLFRMVYNEIPSVRSNSLKDPASCLWEFLRQSDAIHGSRCLLQ